LQIGFWTAVIERKPAPAVQSREKKLAGQISNDNQTTSYRYILTHQRKYNPFKKRLSITLTQNIARDDFRIDA
jgi:hypothetical protein